MRPRQGAKQRQDRSRRGPRISGPWHRLGAQHRLTDCLPLRTRQLVNQDGRDRFQQVGQSRELQRHLGLDRRGGQHRDPELYRRVMAFFQQGRLPDPRFTLDQQDPGPAANVTKKPADPGSLRIPANGHRLRTRPSVDIASVD